MKKFVFFCKSYIGDIDRVLNLINSVKKYNCDNIPFYLSVPSDDYMLFKSKIGENVNIICDESIYANLLTEHLDDFSAGYINQQILKLNFWKTEIAENYLCLDSDSYFIKDFYLSDFMYNDQVPYSILYQWEEHFLNREYIHLVKDYYIFNLDKIKKTLNIKNTRYLTCCGFSILSAKVLKSFEENFLKPNNLTYIDILKISPLEFSWYSQWLLKENDIEIQPKNQLFKIFHYKNEYESIKKKKITEKDIAEMYLGICMNSNWQNCNVPIIYRDPNLFFILFNKQVKIRFNKIFRGLLKRI